MQVHQTTKVVATGPTRRQLRTARLIACSVAIVVSLVLIAVGSAADTSPARGHAQVIAQGATELPDEDLVWRVIERRAEPREETTNETGHLGFVLADEGAILVSDEDGRRTRLAPGEAAFVAAGFDQERASLGASDVEYLALELVADGEADETGDGDRRYAGDPFAGSGEVHDLDLVRDVLDAEESGELSTGEFPALIVVTEGEIEVAVAGEREPTTLRSGEATQLTGDLTVTAGGEGAVYVAAVIGPAIPDEDEATEVVGAVRAAPAATATPAPAATTGSLTVVLRACPEGMRLASLVAERCGLAGGGADLRLVDAAGAGLEPAFDPGTSTLTWSGLGLTEYELIVTRLPGPIETVALDGVSPGVTGGWLIRLTDAEPAQTFALYHFLFPPDTDGDGLPDDGERDVYGTDPTRSDTDGDGLSDGEEILGIDTWGTFDPLDPDMDLDGLLDGEEIRTHGTSPVAADSDADGLLDGDEVSIFGTDPLIPDSDGDMIGDGPEVGSGTAPLNADSDSDGLTDYDEFYTTGTDPLVWDSDRDGLGDGDEIFFYGSEPTYLDTDGDALPDGDEVLFYATNPADEDSDDDLLLDGDEVLGSHGSFTDPLSAYSDTDGLDDGFEVLVLGTSPANSDTDGDLFDDGTEHAAGTNPLDAASHP